METLGTILPNATTRRADAFADRQRALALREAEIELAGLERREVGGEVRFYKTPTIYTVANRLPGQPRRWFEVRTDGDYSIKTTKP